MIYTVECQLTPDQTDDDWARWYGDMKPPRVLLSVPGFLSLQKFKGINVAPPPYFALYSVAGPEILSGDTYRGKGGGNFTTDRWKPLITKWERNLFDGLHRAPPVPTDGLLLVLDAAAPGDSPLGIPFTWLKAVGLQQTTPYRGIAVLGAGDIGRYPLADIAGLRIMRPLMAQGLPEGAPPAA